MVKVTYKNVVTRKNRKGGLYYFYRVRPPGGKEILTRLPDDMRSPEFAAAYKALVAGRESAPDLMHSFSMLIKSYRASPRFQGLRSSTQRGYDQNLNELNGKIGGHDVRAMRRQDVVAMQGAYKATARKANALVVTVSILMEHAIDLDWRRDNPAKGVKPYAQQSEGHRAWTRIEQDQYRRHAMGVCLLAFELALGTGQRRGDLVKATWADWDGEGLSLTQSKTGAKLYVPGTPQLVRALTTERARLPEILPPKTPILHHGRGGAMQPYGPDSLSHLVASAIQAAGLTGVNLHGLRASAAVELAEAGCSPAQIGAITGLKALSMIERYTRDSDQKALAHQARAKMKE